MPVDQSSYAFITFEGSELKNPEVICIKEQSDSNGGFIRFSGGRAQPSDKNAVDTVLRWIRVQTGMVVHRNQVLEVLSKHKETIRRKTSGKRSKIHKYTVSLFRVVVSVDQYLDRTTRRSDIEIRPMTVERILATEDFLRSHRNLLIKANVGSASTEGRG